MASRSTLRFEDRGAQHPCGVARRLFDIAARKQTNLIAMTGPTDSQTLLRCADELGPHIACLWTNASEVQGFDDNTIQNLKSLAGQHGFLLMGVFERISGFEMAQSYLRDPGRPAEWADIVHLGTINDRGINSLAEAIMAPEFTWVDERALVLSKVWKIDEDRSYLDLCVAAGRRHQRIVLGFATGDALNPLVGQRQLFEDFVIFDHVAIPRRHRFQPQTQTIAAAVARGVDFIIADMGDYGVFESSLTNEVPAAVSAKLQGWEAYILRTAFPDPVDLHEGSDTYGAEPMNYSYY